MDKIDVKERFKQIRETMDQEPHKLNSMMDPKFQSFDEEVLTLSFYVEDWMTNQGGVLHGGVLASAFDIGLGCYSLLIERDGFVVTTNMSIQFLREIPKDSTFLIKTYCKRAGRKLISLYAEAIVGDSIAATCLGEYYR